jgi:CDP-diacylglycerol--glycerol-3-phosphate 3-phosphatidyltransferase
MSRVANLITLSRLLLLFVLLGFVHLARPEWQLLNPLLLIVTIALDGVDGYVARMRGETSLFGAVADIVVDRIVDNALWISFAYLGLVPLWVAIAVVLRGTVTDQIRRVGVEQHGQAPFSLAESRWGKWLVGSRFMRAVYGTFKAVTFAWLLALGPWQALAPHAWIASSAWTQIATNVLVAVTAGLCLVRGLPVVADFVLVCGASGWRRRPVEA